MSLGDKYPQKGGRKVYKATKSTRTSGRPAGVGGGSLCTPELTQLAYQKAKEGIPIYIIFPLLGVSKNTVENWRKSNPEFAEAIMKGKAEFSEQLIKDYQSLNKVIDPSTNPETRRKVIEYTLTRTWPEHLTDVTIEVKDSRSPAQIAFEARLERNALEAKKKKNE